MSDDRGRTLAAVLSLFLGLTWLFVSLRVYVKLFLTKSWGKDDYFLIISLVFFTTYATCSLTGVKYGTGKHLPDIPEADIPRALYYWFLCEIFYTVTTVFLRNSIAIFLLRICMKSIHRYIIYGTMSTIILFSIGYFFLVIFQCSPVSFFWNQYRDMSGSCINPAVVPDTSVAHSALSAACDWIFGLLPIALIWHLHINVRTKFSIAGVLALGLLAGVATLIRIPYIKVLEITDNFLYATTDVAIWSTIEPGLGIIAFSIAPLRPLFRSFYNITSQPPSHHHNNHTTTADQIPFSEQAHQRQRHKPPNESSSDAATATNNSIRLRADIVAGGAVTITSTGNSTDIGSGIEDGIQVQKTVDVESRRGSRSTDHIPENDPEEALGVIG